MRNRIVTIALLVIPIFAVGQTGRLVPISVVDSHVDPARPVPHARLQLRALSGGNSVAQGKVVTNDKGVASAQIDVDALDGAKVRVEIEPSDVPGLVIFEPAGGIIEALPPTLSVKLLPRGSPALLGPAQCEALLFRYTQANDTLRSQNATLRGKLADTHQKLQAANLAKQQFEEAQAEWAAEYGFTAQVVQEKIVAWANEVRVQQSRATLRQRMLAAFATGEYAEAVRLAQQGEAESDAELNEEQDLYLKGLRKSLRDRLGFAETEAKAQEAQLQYALAATAIQNSLTRISDAHNRYPDDSQIAATFVEAFLGMNSAQLAAAEADAGSSSSSLSKQSTATMQSFLKQIDHLARPHLWAFVAMRIGISEILEARFVSGKDSVNLMKSGLASINDSLTVFSLDKFPVEWATANLNAGVVYADLSRVSDHAEAIRYSDEAIASLSRAVQVFSKSEDAEEYSLVEVNLAAAYMERVNLSASAGDAKHYVLLSIDACTNALSVTKREEAPRQWARLQIDLGTAYVGMSEHADGDESRGYLLKGVQAITNALQIYTKDNLPQEWSTAEVDLGVAETDLAEGGTKGQVQEHLNAAINAFEHSLEVRTRDASPRQWAEVQMNVGTAYMSMGNHLDGDSSVESLQKSIRCYENAAEVETEANVPSEWVKVQINLGKAYNSLAAKSAGQDARRLYNQAAGAYRSALEVDTKDQSPDAWAQINILLGMTLLHAAQKTQQVGLLHGALAAFQSSAEVFTKEDYPQVNEFLTSTIQEITDFLSK